MLQKIILNKSGVNYKNSHEYFEKICAEEQGMISFYPFVDQNAFVHDTANLIGGIYISENCFLGPYCVLRMDEENCVNGLFVGKNSNLQDHVVVHSKNNRIGNHCNIAHHAVIHGSTIGDNSTVYIQSVVDHTDIGVNCFIDAKCYIRSVKIPDNSYIPPGSFITNMETLKQLIQPITDKFIKIHNNVNKLNVEHAKNYQKLKS
jgi:carbonic anhydrase/acetyltransferase-like protein (isoleucine patch superfamily)